MRRQIPIFEASTCEGGAMLWNRCSGNAPASNAPRNARRVTLSASRPTAQSPRRGFVSPDIKALTAKRCAPHKGRYVLQALCTAKQVWVRLRDRGPDHLSGHSIELQGLRPYLISKLFVTHCDFKHAPKGEVTVTAAEVEEMEAVSGDWAVAGSAEVVVEGH